jgi:hypothetical protein
MAEQASGRQDAHCAMVARGQLRRRSQNALAAKAKSPWPQAVLRFFAQSHKVSV